jgi:tricorn protease
VASIQDLLYDEWVAGNRKAVEAASAGKLGYLHIRGMDMRSVRQMEEDLYAAGHGKDGLIVDVRFNGGGSTTDHVLTILTQPVHAITRSRGSGDGYPVDRKVYASWGKPIVLMCNEYSFSNAEILAHAIKQIGRGRIVGMRTGGGVISTGSASLADGSSVRMPTRGWYLVSTGEDMELNGCLPDLALWNPPGGPDAQLERAVGALAEDVAAANQAQRPVPVPAALKRRQVQGPGGGGR